VRASTQRPAVAVLSRPPIRESATAEVSLLEVGAFNLPCQQPATEIMPESTK